MPASNILHLVLEVNRRCRAYQLSETLFICHGRAKSKINPALDSLFIMASAAVKGQTMSSSLRDQLYKLLEGMLLRRPLIEIQQYMLVLR